VTGRIVASELTFVFQASPPDRFSAFLDLAFAGVAPSKGLCAARSQVLRVVRQVGLRGPSNPPLICAFQILLLLAEIESVKVG
jgi:hypothetical protein